MKIFLAGAENKSHSHVLKNTKAEHVLVSYLLMTKNSSSEKIKERMIWLKGEYPTAKIICDSGAATLQKGVSEKELDLIADRYKNFIKDHKDLFFTCVELDIYNLFPKQKILDIRKELEKYTENLLPVWHGNMTIDEWKVLLKNYKYVGIGQTKNLSVNMLKCLLKLAIEAKVKVHGFAVTQMNRLKECPFYSVDSTTWLNGALYGNALEFKGGIIKKHLSKGLISRKKNPESKVTHPSQFADMEERLKQGVYSFRKMESFLTSLWNERGINYDNF